MRSISVIGLPVAATDYASAVAWILEKATRADRPYAVEAANTHVAALSRSDADFSESIRKFDLITPDGMPLVWSINAQLPANEKLTDRVYGPTLMLKTIEASATANSSYRHFLLGGQQSTLDKLIAKFSGDFPDATIAGAYSPPFGEWPEQENESIIARIRESGAFSCICWLAIALGEQVANRTRRVLAEPQIPGGRADRPFLIAGPNADAIARHVDLTGDQLPQVDARGD